MKTHQLVQGSDAWNEFRLSHFGASEAAAMLGLSKKMTRNDLLKLKATGTAKEFSDYVQKNILDYGHEVEAQARPLIEKLIGKELYPVTCSDGKLSASCDGLTIAGDIAFEHKQWNESLANSIIDNVLPDEHWPQCHQILMITGASKLIFAVSDGTEENLVWMVVAPDQQKFDHIKAGWAQFEKDLANYEHKPAAEKPVADSIESFPMAMIQARGEIIVSNLDQVLPRFDLFLSSQKTELVTDDDFANGESVAKFSRETAKKLRLIADQTIDQISTVSEAVRALENYADKFDGLGLKLEKLVKSEKEARKDSIINAAKVLWREHLDSLDAELNPVHLHIAPPDFIGAVKSKRTIEALQNAVDTALAQCKMAADAMAKVYGQNLAWANENASDFNFLYANDLSAIISKDHEDFKNLIESRISAYKTQEEAKKQVIEPPKPEVKEVAKEAPKAVIAKTQSPQSIDTNKVSEFINSRDWPSESARNTARATCIEFYKFINQEHLQAA